MRIPIDNDAESRRIKAQAKADVIKELSGKLTPEQIEKFSSVFDEVAAGYKFSEKKRV